MNIIIVGGGIGGLATAVALKRVGISACVYERAPAIQEIGAGFTIWSNAMKALRRIGLEEQALSLGSVIRIVHTFSPEGNLVSSENLDSISRACNADSICIHRADLQRILAEELGHEHIITGHECVGVDTDSTPHRVLFADGSTAEAEIVIGADGLHSAIRRTLLGPEEPQYAGYYCYRAIVNAPELPDNEAFFSMLHGVQVGFFPFGRKGQTYWFACPNASKEEAHLYQKQQHRASLNSIANKLPLKFGKIIAGTKIEQVIIGDIADRPPNKNWGKNGVTLLGDAAHPTTPNLGQGACMAIEDAIVLADQLSRTTNPVQGLRSYEKLRYRRTAAITRASRNIGRVYQLESQLLVRMRTAAFRFPLASWVGRRTQRNLLQYEPPEL